MKEENQDGSREYLVAIGSLAWRWNRLRADALLARKARADSRAAFGPCTRKSPEGYSEPCWQVTSPIPGEEPCPSCKAQFPLHNKYRIAVHKAAVALTILRREIKNMETREALRRAARGEALAEPQHKPPVTSTLPQGQQGGDNAR